MGKVGLMLSDGVSNSDGTGTTGKVNSRGGAARLAGGRPLRFLAVLAGAALIASACGSSSGTKASGATAASPTTASSGAGSGVTVKIGYFPNITHAPALVGVQAGIFAKDLGTDKLATPQIFSAGPAENTALLSGSIDIAFEGPSSALSAYSASKSVTIIAGAAAGGAGLVVNRQDHQRQAAEGHQARLAPAGQHPGHRPAVLAQDAGVHDDVHRRRRRLRRAVVDGERHGRHRVQGRPDRRGVDAGAVRAGAHRRRRPPPGARGHPVAERRMGHHQRRGPHGLPPGPSRRRSATS